MKSYRSIPRLNKRFKPSKFHTFDKVDGSNLRFEWNGKKGWYKFGTRNHLIDESDPMFGMAIPLFHSTLGEPLAKICAGQGWQSAIVFCEFWGKNSFAGQHDPDDLKQLTLIDVNPYKKGFLPPDKFLDLFGEFGPNYLGELFWDRETIDEFRAGKKGITFEGVVGKRVEGKQLLMYKVKTDEWIKRVLDKFGTKVGNKIIHS